MKKKRIAITAALIAVLTLAIACWAYVGDYYRADEAAIQALQSSETVNVQAVDGAGMVFVPETAKTGLIFYPGGKVEYTAYAPLMRALAEEDVLCILVEMPLNLAVLDMNAAYALPAMYPQFDSWYLRGHSLAVSIAASYSAGHPGAFERPALRAACRTAALNGSVPHTS